MACIEDTPAAIGAESPATVDFLSDMQPDTPGTTTAANTRTRRKGTARMAGCLGEREAGGGCRDAGRETLEWQE